MDSIDLMEWRHNAWIKVSHGIDTAALAIADVTGFDVIIGVVVFAMVLAAYEWHRRWTEGKGLRMAVDHEQQRVKRWLSDGITDLILTGEVNGQISTQQGDKLYMHIAKTLDLPDLIPAKRRAKLVKQEIKGRLRSPKHQVKTPVIPGGLPKVTVRQPYRQTYGSLVSKFWKKS